MDCMTRPAPWPRRLPPAVGYFAMDQLPELYAGTQRDASNFPVQYLGANVPQGWAAGSIFSLLQSLLGFQPDAPTACYTSIPICRPGCPT